VKTAIRIAIHGMSETGTEIAPSVETEETEGCNDVMRGVTTTIDVRQEVIEMASTDVMEGAEVVEVEVGSGTSLLCSGEQRRPTLHHQRRRNLHPT
jgi:hypothetical protein